MENKEVTPSTAMDVDAIVNSAKQSIHADARKRAILTLLLACLSMLGPFSLDTYLPAFQAMEAALPATEVQMQLSLTIYFVGFAVFALFHGAVSDAIGRKPVIVVTLIVHAVGSIGCALSGSIGSLLLFRLLQGMFAGAGFVVGRAVIRDLFDGDDAQRQLSRVQMIFSAAPVVAPILGGWIVSYLTWPWIFWFLATFAGALALWTHLSLPESHPPSKRLPLAIKPLLKTYQQIFFSKRFQLLAAIPSINFMGFFVYIAGAPALILTHLQYTVKDFWMLFIPGIGGITIAVFLSGRVAGRITMRTQVNIGFAVIAVAAIVNLIVSAWVPPNVWVHIAPFFVYAIGMAFITPPITISLLDAYAWARGTVSALQSACQVAMSAFVTAFIVAHAQKSLLGFAVVMAVTPLIAFVLWLLYRKSFGDSSPTNPNNELANDVYETT